MTVCQWLHHAMTLLHQIWRTYIFTFRPFCLATLSRGTFAQSVTWPLSNTYPRNCNFCAACENIGWNDVTYLWLQCDRHFVGQHVILCVVKWWRFVALFEYNWISWIKKMSVLSLSYWESDVYWRQNSKHFAELAPQNDGKQLIWKNYITVTLCIVV